MFLARHMPLALLLAALANPGLADSQLYRWTDEDGQVHYSDSLPPERAPDKRREFSRAGSMVRDVERAPTESEIRALEEARQAAAKAQAEQAEQRRLQAKYDRMLTHTYISVSQLERNRDQRIDDVRTLKNASLARQERYERDILELQERAARAERTGTNSDPEVIYQRIASKRERLAFEQNYSRGKEAEIVNIQNEFSAYISRFRELQSGR